MCHHRGASVARGAIDSLELESDFLKLTPPDGRSNLCMQNPLELDVIPSHFVLPVSTILTRPRFTPQLFWYWTGSFVFDRERREQGCRSSSDSWTVAMTEGNLARPQGI